MSLIITKVPLFQPIPVKVSFDIKTPVFERKPLPVIQPTPVFKKKGVAVINPVRVPLPMPVFKTISEPTPLKVSHPEANHVDKPVTLFDPTPKPVEQTFVQTEPKQVNVEILIPRPMIPSDGQPVPKPDYPVDIPVENPVVPAEEPMVPAEEPIVPAEEPVILSDEPVVVAPDEAQMEIYDLFRSSVNVTA